MPAPPTIASATAAAAASAHPGAATPLLCAWLVVRRRSFLSFPKRRYLTLTADHVLLVDSTPVLHLVDCVVTSHPSPRTVDLHPAPGSGLPVRLYADSPFQYSKWRLALQSAAAASVHRFYRIDPHAFLGVGVHGIVRRAFPHAPFRDDSTESAATATTTTTTAASEFSAQPPDHRSISLALFRRRSHVPTRDSIDIDPDDTAYTTDDLPENAVPSTKNDKRIFRQVSLKVTEGVAGEGMDRCEPGLDTAVAVKTVSRTTNGPATVASEMLAAKARLSHFAIVKILDVFEAVNEVHVVMDECLGGSLMQYVQTNGPLAEPAAKAVFSPVLKGVGYMHACGVVHWDISPNNILFAKPGLPVDPKLIDFGTARPINPSNGRVPVECGIFMEKGKVASLACASPELLTSKAHRYAAKADMWQLGCVLYYMLVGKLPFCKRNVQDISVSSTILWYCKKRSAERREFLFGEQAMGTREISEPAKQLVAKLLCPNPRMRPNALNCLREFTYLTHASR